MRPKTYELSQEELDRIYAQRLAAEDIERARSPYDPFNRRPANIRVTTFEDEVRSEELRLAIRNSLRTNPHPSMVFTDSRVSNEHPILNNCQL